MPPEMRKAGSEMPSRVSSQLPAREVPNRISAAIRAARQATVRRVASDIPCVMLANAGASPIGSITTASVTRVESANSAHTEGPLGDSVRPHSVRHYRVLFTAPGTINKHLILLGNL